MNAFTAMLFVARRPRIISTSAVTCSWIVLLLSLSAQAQVVYNIAKLIDNSDVVAVARITAISQTGSGNVVIPGGQSIPAHFRVAAMHLQNVLRGEPPSTDITVRYTVLYSLGGWGGGVPQGYTIRDTLIHNPIRLVFLKRTHDHYDFTNGSYLSVVCAPETPTGSEPPHTLNRVMSRIAGALFSPSLLQQDQAEAIRQLGAVDSEAEIPVLHRFLYSDKGREDEFLRTETLVALLFHKDESVVNMAGSELLNGSSEYWKSKLLFALTRAMPPSRSIPIIAQALAAPTAQMRMSAVEAIYGTNSPEGISPLLRSLEDPDREVAFAIMQGLGNLTKQYEWRPKSTKLDDDWFQCLNHWREFGRKWNGAR